MADEQKQMPRATVAAFIVNGKGEIFLMHSPKWQNKLVPPGGHIEYGETAEDALRREVLEETGLKIKHTKLLTAIDMIEEPDYIKGKKHFVGLEMKAELDGEEQDVRLQETEGSDYVWLKPADAVKRNDMERFTKETIETYFVDSSAGACAQCSEYKAGWMRAQADYQNLQKEVQRQRSEWVRMSEAQVLEEFLPVYGNFKKAFGMEHGTWDMEQKNWAQGIEFIKKQFGDVLKRHGIEEIKTVGEKFDPVLHETVGEEEADDEEGMIVREVEGGYKMGEKVIKVAKVVVSKKITDT